MKDKYQELLETASFLEALARLGKLEPATVEQATQAFVQIEEGMRLIYSIAAAARAKLDGGTAERVKFERSIINAELNAAMEELQIKEEGE